MVARTTGDPVALSAALRQAVAGVDPDLAAGDVRTIDDYLAQSIATPRFNATLIAGFAGLALFLACGLLLAASTAGAPVGTRQGNIYTGSLYHGEY